MVWLCAGVLLWMVVHLIPSLAQGFRNSLVERVGENPYKGIFALALVLSIALMIVGWRSTTPGATTSTGRDLVVLMGPLPSNG